MKELYKFIPSLIEQDEAGSIASLISEEAGSWDGDDQVPCSHSTCNNSICNILLGRLTQRISELVGRNLAPTYSYIRVYLRGAELVPHKDRPSCEYSATINLSQTHPWSIFMGDSEIKLNVGDAVIYKGCEIEHSRKPFEGDSYIQVFLHYVDLDGPYRDHVYDITNIKKKETMYEFKFLDSSENQSNYYKFIHLFPGVVVDRLREELDKRTLLPARIGVGSNGTLDTVKRSSMVAWVPKTSEFVDLYSSVMKAVLECNTQFYQFKLTGLSDHIQYTVYDVNKNGHYDWHIDMGPSNHRKLSVVIMLSDPSEYDGGQLELNDGSILHPENEKGTMILFPSYMLHRVTPVTRGVRRTLVAWVDGPPFV